MSKLKHYLLILGTVLCLLLPINTYGNELMDEENDIFDYLNMVEMVNKVPILDFDGNIVGTCVKCTYDSADYGYFIVDNNNNMLEYSIVEDQKFLYDTISEFINSDYIVEDNCLYSSDNVQYFIKAVKENVTYLFNQYGESTIAEGFASSTNQLDGWSDIIVDVSEYSGNSRYSLVESYNKPGYAYLAQSFFENYCKRYACSVVAMVNLCIQEGYFQHRNSNGSLNITNICNAFQLLWSLSNTYVNSTIDGIQYGTTYDRYINSAIQDFCYTMTNRIISVGGMTNPTYEQIVNVVKKGKSSIFSSRVYIRNGQTYSEKGHSVNVIGYAIYYDSVTGKNVKILKIADGWNERARYLIFNNDNFSSSYYSFIQ